MSALENGEDVPEAAIVAVAVTKPEERTAHEEPGVIVEAKEVSTIHHHHHHHEVKPQGLVPPSDVELPVAPPRKRQPAPILHNFTHDNPPPPSQLFVPSRTRNKGNFLCIALIAPEPRRADEKRQWTSDDALGAWCTQCNCNVMWKKGESNGLSRHMRKHHPNILSDAGIRDSEPSSKMQDGEKPPKRQKTDSSTGETNFNARLTKYHQLPGAARFGVTNQLKFEALTLLWIHKNFRPYSMVEDKGLQEMISFASGMSAETHLFPSQDSLRMASSTLNVRCDEKIRAVINDEADYFSVTVETWEASSSLSFVGILLHFTNEQFETKTITLRIAILPKAATSERIDEMMVQTLDSWGLTTAKMAMVLRGNGRSLENAFATLEPPTEPCAGLCLHWIISPFYLPTEPSMNGDVALFEMDERAASQVDKEHVSAVRAVVGKVREIMAFVQSSAEAQSKIHEYQASAQEAGGEGFDKQLKTDVPTQWPSTHEMIHDAVQQQYAISSFLAYLETVEGKAHFPQQKLAQITPADWALLAGIRVLLTPIYSLIDGLREQKTPRMIYAYPFLRKVQTILDMPNLFQSSGDAERERCGPLIKESVARFLDENSNKDYFSSVLTTLEACQATLKEEFAVRFKSLDNVFQWASMMDPRLRKQHHCSDEERNQAKESLVFEMLALNQASGLQQSNPGQSEQQVMPSEKRRPFFPAVFSDVFDDPGEEGHDVNPLKTEEGHDESIDKNAAHHELNSYLSAPALSKDSSPWTWWQTHGTHYPMLARVARKWLSVSVGPWIPDDRIFSMIGLVTATRNPSACNVVESSPDFEQQLQINAKLNSLALSADEIAECLQAEHTTNSVHL